MEGQVEGGEEVKERCRGARAIAMEGIADKMVEGIRGISYQLSLLQLFGSEIISPVWFQIMSSYGHHERRPPVTPPLPGPKARGAWTPVLPVNHCSSTAPRWPEAGDKAGVRRDLTMSDVRMGDAGEWLESNIFINCDPTGGTHPSCHSLICL